MPAHSLETSDQIARQSDAMLRTQFLGIELAIKMPASAATCIVRDERTRPANAARGKATHTDPQILFPAAS
jgi:hypothetical protein